jgi:two-component system, cell cycle sensor histidine kinase and response regulator CckA
MAVLRAVLESPKKIVIFSLDNEYRYLAFNENHRRTMLAIWDAEIALGESMLEYIQREDDRRKAKSNFDRALAGEHFSVIEEYGDKQLTRRHFEDVYSPIMDQQGKVLGMTVFLTDITEQVLAERELKQHRKHLEQLVQQRTVELADANQSLQREIAERKRGEQALKQSEQRYRSLVENSPLPIFVVIQDLIVYLNPAAVELFEAESELDVLNYPFRSLVEPEYQTHVAFQSTPTAILRAELKVRSLRGTLFDIEMTALGVNFEGHDARLFLAVDITERKRAEQEALRLAVELQHAQKLESLGLLTGSIAHDFNNLLVGLLGNADLALKELAVQSPARNHVSNIKKTAILAAELSNQMLAYSGKGQFVVEVIDLNRVILDMGELLHASIAKSATLHYELAETPPRIKGDVAQIRQIILNLITNAAEAIPESGGTITLRTAQVTDTNTLPSELSPLPYVFLEVSDTGCGIDLDTQSHLFEPFYSTKVAGRGLGLAAVDGIVRGHQGAIELTSNLGQGTTFRVYLPESNEKPARASMVSITGVDEWRGEGTILIADDEVMVRNVTAEMLRLFGFDTITAHDGESCIACFQEHHSEIVAVLVDMTMPRMSGKKVFEELRKISASIPIILFSGYSEQEVGFHVVGQQHAAFLQKPFELDALLSKLRHILEPQRSGRSSQQAS